MKDSLSRLFNALKKYSFVELARKIRLFIHANVFDRLNVFSYFHLRSIRSEVSRALCEEHDRIIIRASSFGYDVPLFQRPQQLAKAMTKKGCLIFYEVTSMSDKVRYISRISERLYLVNLNVPAVYRTVFREVLKSDRPKYIEVYSTDRRLSEKELCYYKALGFGIIYQYVDHISPEIFGTATVSESIMEKYRYAMRYPEVFIIATAERLFRDVTRHRGPRRVILSTNGVDAEHFSTFDGFDFEDRFKSILATKKPLVCYYGALASWIDYELLQSIADDGRFSLVLIGIKYDDSFDRFKGKKNIHFLGHREYSVLKYYARACDVLIIPFKVNNITRATSPIKVFEYMAIGRPIVSTDINECRKYKSVLTAKSHGEFIGLLENALILKNDDRYKALLYKEACENTWARKADEIITLLKEGE